eukprot:747219-Hanusia_phi.AAC.2
MLLLCPFSPAPYNFSGPSPTYAGDCLHPCGNNSCIPVRVAGPGSESENMKKLGNRSNTLASALKQDRTCRECVIVLPGKCRHCIFILLA